MTYVEIDSSRFLRLGETTSWDEFISSYFFTHEGELFLVDNVIVRNDSLGPIFETSLIRDGNTIKRMYSLRALRTGKIKTVKIPENKFLSISSRSQKKNSLADLDPGPVKYCADTINNINKVESTHFELILFDLDNTLIETENLESFRNREFANGNDPESVINLLVESCDANILIAESTILDIKRTFPNIKIGILTRSPRTYATTLLEAFYPKVKWDIILAFEDAKPKPAPDGVLKAKKNLGVTSTDRICIVGDGECDIDAAYNAGAYIVFYATKQNPDVYSQKKLPDAIVNNEQHLVDVLQFPKKYLPQLEALLEDDALSIDIDKLRPPFKLRKYHVLKDIYPRVFVEIHVFARYFSANCKDRNHLKESKRNSHATSNAIIQAKDYGQFPPKWPWAILKFISDYSNRNVLNADDIITCIPAKHGRPRRMENFLNEIANINSCNDLKIIDNLLFFSEESSPCHFANKTKEERFNDAEKNLNAVDGDLVFGNRIFIVDDVTTSGATLFHAKNKLLAKKAREVVCLALTCSV